MKKRLIIYPHIGGFFSQFNKVISCVSWADSKGHICAVEWNKTNPEFAYGDTTVDGNLWECFFEPLSFGEDKNVEYEPVEIVLYGGVVEGIDSKEFKKHMVPTGTNAKISRHLKKKFNKIFKKYIRVKKHILERVEYFYNNEIKGNFCVGLLIRNPVQEEDRYMPLVDDFIRKIRELFPRKVPKIFVVTDINEAIPKLKEKFGEQVIAQQNIKRGEFICAPWQYRAKFKTNETVKPNKKFGEDILSEALLLSRCDLFVYPVSNISTAVAYINPNLKMIRLKKKAKTKWWKFNT